MQERIPSICHRGEPSSSAKSFDGNPTTILGRLTLRQSNQMGSGRRRTSLLPGCLGHKPRVIQDVHSCKTHRMTSSSDGTRTNLNCVRRSAMRRKSHRNGQENSMALTRKWPAKLVRSPRGSVRKDAMTSRTCKPVPKRPTIAIAQST